MDVFLKENILFFCKAMKGDIVYSARFATSLCDWIDGSAFKHSEPKGINKQIVHYVNNSIDIMERPNIICHCTDDQTHDCDVDELGPVFHTL